MATNATTFGEIYLHWHLKLSDLGVSPTRPDTLDLIISPLFLSLAGPRNVDRTVVPFVEIGGHD